MTKVPKKDTDAKKSSAVLRSAERTVVTLTDRDVLPSRLIGGSSIAFRGAIVRSPRITSQKEVRISTQLKQSNEIAEYVSSKLLDDTERPLGLPEEVLRGIEKRVPEVTGIKAIRQLRSVIVGGSLANSDRETLTSLLSAILDVDKSLVDQLATHIVSSEKPGTSPMLSSSQEHGLPEIAPATWKDAKQPRETPPEFIKRTYEPWLGKGLTKAHLRHLDNPLVRALDNWLRRNEMPSDLDLPTLKEQNSRWVEKLEKEGYGAAISTTDPNEIVREARRLQSVQSRRRRGSQNI
jgi:hypothetical protein